MVTLYLLPTSRIGKAAEQAIPGDLWIRVKRVYVTRTRDIPTKGHMVLFGGSQTPEAKLEWWAAGKGGYVCCLPEADDYLGGAVRTAFAAGQDLVLIDAALRKLRA